MHEVATSLSAVCEKSSSSYASLIDWCSALSVSRRKSQFRSITESNIKRAWNSGLWFGRYKLTHCSTHSRVYMYCECFCVHENAARRPACSRASPFHASLCVFAFGRFCCNAALDKFVRRRRSCIEIRVIRCAWIVPPRSNRGSPNNMPHLYMYTLLFSLYVLVRVRFGAGSGKR
jgi:hypothetical protein